MDMHRSTGLPDWENVSQNDWNRWQRHAQATHSLITPGNVISILGLLGVFLSLLLINNTHYRLGLIILAVSRLLDIVDGWAAQITGTKSPFGERIDAATDKIATFA